MLRSLRAAFERAAMERLTLLLNHVLGAEPVATARLSPHAGATLQVEFAGWPSLLPSPPRVAYRITPAGLFEWLGDERLDSPALRIEADASNPARSLAEALTGTRPRVQVSGDATLAADVQWLMDNVRWDVEDDLASIVGPAAAHAIGRLGRAVAAGVREMVRAAGALAERAGGSGSR
jgi:ubiquinone biosynthesis protein UbiJ